MKLKVCGMKDQENMKALASLHPDMMGLIFYEKSPRYFNGVLPEFEKAPELTGVFVNTPVMEIVEKTKQYGLKYIQLHGEESPDYCRQLKQQLANEGISCPLIKAFAISEASDLEGLPPYVAYVDIFLFDSKGKYRGGNGTAFNWDLLSAYTLDVPYLLSGGIGPEDAEKLREFTNSKEAVRCIGIDVNSKFETAPGQKDIALLRSFIEKFVPAGGSTKK
ncbi:phosphoribosylanthranilate isomerase [Robertkochia sediminum]|uniref:phosphoribosylanthranilate isomerase n=1 Tax=Robertkochia sediminum TaxID=2785326 RepID=UPI001932EBBF|nr:phosphoribosylanthranilate isomerase [Robertkochia sediminum]MBL7471620.1 phosphoribosylanthranilate isomerase [Robertkochia sediminum]